MTTTDQRNAHYDPNSMTPRADKDSNPRKGKKDDRKSQDGANKGGDEDPAKPWRPGPTGTTGAGVDVK